MVIAAIALAIASAVSAAVGTYLQHASVGRIADGGELTLRQGTSLFRDRSWMLGTLAHVGTSWFQIAAISLAPLVVVQPMVVLSLPLVALLGVIGWGRQEGQPPRRLNALAVAGIAATMAGLASFIVIAAIRAQATTVTGAQAFNAGKFVLVAAVGLVVLGSLRAGKIKCLLLAVAAGTISGFVSVLTRHITAAIRANGIDSLPWLSLIVAVGAFLCATWLVQKSYAHGPADLVVACITTTNPIVAIGIGMAVLGETAGAGADTTTWLTTCGAVACGGIIALAASHSTILSAGAEAGAKKVARVLSR